MSTPHQTSPPARVSLIYITVGSLVVVWTAVWFTYLWNHPPQSNQPYYWVTGLLITGLTLLIIGFSLGQIGRVSRPAEAPAIVPAPAPLVPVNGTPAVAVPPPVTPGVPLAQVAPGMLPPQQPIYQAPGTGTVRR